MSRPQWFVTPQPVRAAHYIADGDWRERKRKGTRRLGKKFRKLKEEVSASFRRTRHASVGKEDSRAEGHSFLLDL